MAYRSLLFSNLPARELTPLTLLMRYRPPTNDSVIGGVVECKWRKR
jgi:hypothetical protein